MTGLGRLILLPVFFLVLSHNLVFAAAGLASSAGATESKMSDLTSYVLNLGKYFGYNLEETPGSSGSGLSNSNISLSLINLSAMELMQNFLFNSFLGAIPVSSSSQGGSLFVPSSTPAYAALNAFANYTFTSSSYSSNSSSKISVNPLIDQPTYQTDPVSQSVLNILATPDYSYCLTNDGSAVTKCSYPTGIANNAQIAMNVAGNLPDTQTYFSYNYNQPFLSQLNGNSLVGPLLYTTSENTTTSTTSGGAPGLVAQNQAQQAQNFIRYATSAVTPLRLPNRTEYDNYFVQAQNLDKSFTQVQQLQAQTILASYLNSLRAYAAQTSIGVSNLYYILSKRMPQSQSTSSNGQQTSQALSEFAMATWRLYNPDQSTNTQWLAQINQASNATVQKEIAGLLAEINYQLYLSRQQQERILLTNSMILLQYMHGTQPSLSNAGGNALSTPQS